MRIAVVARDGPFEYTVKDECVVGDGADPSSRSALINLSAAVKTALDQPLEFPPLARAIVPGDHVAIPVDPTMPGLDQVLRVLVDLTRQAGAEQVSVVATGPGPQVGPEEGVTWVVHDPGDRNNLAYLASSQEGHRVYLNRILTDADIVIPVGSLDYDAALGYGGPWATLYPGMSDRDTRKRFRALAVDDPPDRDRPRPGLAEASEVSWLLGSQFQLGLVQGASEPVGVVAGIDSAVRDQGAAAVDATWSHRLPDRADLVIVGVGAPGKPSTIEDLSLGLATAARAARRGGKIAVLARVDDLPGTALIRLSKADESRLKTSSLRGLEKEADYLAARRIAAAVDWADVYLHSNLDADLVDDLGMIPVDRAENLEKLVDRSPSTLFLGQAERVRVVIENEVAEPPSSDE